MEKNIRVETLKNLYVEIRKARTGDLSRAIDFLRSAREIHQGKSNQRRQARKNYVKKQIEKADLPFWW